MGRIRPPDPVALLPAAARRLGLHVGVPHCTSLRRRPRPAHLWWNQRNHDGTRLPIDLGGLHRPVTVQAHHRGSAVRIMSSASHNPAINADAKAHMKRLSRAGCGKLVLQGPLPSTRSTRRSAPPHAPPRPACAAQSTRRRVSPVRSPGSRRCSGLCVASKRGATLGLTPSPAPAHCTSAAKTSESRAGNGRAGRRRHGPGQGRLPEAIEAGAKLRGKRGSQRRGSPRP